MMRRLLLCLIALTWTATAHAATVHVGKSGSDANSCPTATGVYVAANAKLTIAAGEACLSPGDKLQIHAGTYAESIVLNATLRGLSGSSWATATTFEAATGESVTLLSIGGCMVTGTTQYVIFRGADTSRNLHAGNVNLSACGGAGTLQYFRFQNMEVSGAHNPANTACLGLGGSFGPNGVAGNYSEILNLVIHGCGTDDHQHGIYNSASHVLVQDTEIYDSSCYGLHHNGQQQLDGGAYDPSDNVYERLFIHGNGYYLGAPTGSCGGFVFNAGSRNVLKNSLIVNNIQGGGMNAFQAGTGNQVLNNTFYGNGVGSFACGGFCYPVMVIGGASTSAAIRQNIFYNNNDNTVSNLGSGSTVSNNSTSNPLFTNGGGSFALASDFAIPVGSPDVNAGDDLTSLGVTGDYIQTPRPKGGTFDIGAYEFVPTGGGGHTAVGPLALISSTTAGTAASASSVATAPVTHTAGNTIACGITWATLSGVTFVRIENTAADVWHLAPSEIVSNVGDTQRVMYAYDSNGHASDVVTVTFSGATIYGTLDCKEFQGVDYNAGDPLIDSAAAEGTGSISTRSLSVGGNPDALLFAYMESAGADANVGTITPGGGMTMNNFAVTGDARKYYADEYAHVSANTAATATGNPVTTWAINAVTFKSFAPTMADPAQSRPAANAAALAAILAGTLNPGDTVDLTAGVNYGRVVLPDYGDCGSSPITLRTSPWTGPAAGIRVAEADSAAFAIIEATDTTQESLKVAQHASCWSIKRVWVKPTQGADKRAGNIVVGTDTETDATQQPTQIVIEQVLCTGDPSADTRRCIAANSRDLRITESSFLNFREVGAEAQAFASWNGPGPFYLCNNTFEATTQGAIFGGSNPGILGMNPTGITICDNLITKKESWNEHGLTYGGINYVIKNSLEIKKGINVLIEGNIIEYAWGPDQDGTDLVISICNQSGGDDTATIRDITVQNNVFRHAGNVMNFLQGSCDHNPTVDGYNLTVQNNSAYDIGTATYPSSTGNNGAAITTFQGFFDNVNFNHNTFPIAVPYRIMTFSWDAATKKVTNFSMKDNIFSFGLYGIYGSDSVGDVPYYASAAMTHFTTAGQLKNNIMAGILESGYGGTTADYGGNVPNYFPSSATLAAQFTNAATGDYRLIAGSVYKVGGASPPSDTSDIGVNMCNGEFPDPAGNGSTKFSCGGVTPPSGRPRVRMIRVDLGSPREMGNATYRAFKGQLSIVGAN